MLKQLKQKEAGKGVFLCTVLVTLICISANSVHAQLYASCTNRTIFKYDKIEKEYEYQYGYEENSMFKVNKKMSMFEHTTSDMSSTYYVSSSRYDEDEQTLTMDVVSDVGNKYQYEFDVKNDLISVQYDRDGESYLIIFTVKKFWTEE